MESVVRKGGAISTLLSRCCPFALLLIALFLSVAFTSTPAYAVGQVRYIDVVYDDSGSMNIHDTRWCSAHYAIEVFAAMLGEDDELRVFTMSAADEGDTQPDLTILGSDSMQQRVAKAHELFSREHGSTNFNAAENAYADLISRDASAERWLVVLTDGAFTVVDGAADGEEFSYIQGKFEEWANEGLRVEYVGFSEEAKSYNSKGGFASQIIGLDEILPGVIAESNKIFGRAELPKSAYNQANGQLSLDIPLGKIVVFAQGENASVGKLDIAGSAEAGGVSASPNETAHVKYTDQANAIMGDSWQSTPPDTSLQGVVAVFDAPDERGFPSGDARLDASGSEISIYYQPSVNVELTLTNTDTHDDYVLDHYNASFLPPGTYQSAYKLKDPYTNAEVISNLIDPAKTSFSTRLSMDGAAPVNIPDGGEVTISEGRAEISGVAIINDEVEVRQQYDLSILAKNLEVTKVSGPEGPIDKYDLASAKPFVVKVRKLDAELTQEEWKHTKLLVGSPAATKPWGPLGWLFGTEKSIGATCAPGVEPGTFEVQLQPYKNSPANTLSGDVPLVFQAVYDPGYGQSYGELSINQQVDTNILLDLLNWLRLHVLQLILLILLALIIAFILLEMSKPRLPKIKPRVRGIDGAPNEEVALRYKAEDVQHRIWPPWSPEVGTIKVSAKGTAGDPWSFSRRFHLANQKLEIVATKTKAGKKGLKFTDGTLAMMAKHKESRGLPEPGYSGEKAVFAPSGGFNFQGMQPHPRRGWDRPEETTYRIVF